MELQLAPGVALVVSSVNGNGITLFETTDMRPQAHLGKDEDELQGVVAAPPGFDSPLQTPGG